MQTIIDILLLQDVLFTLIFLLTFWFHILQFYKYCKQERQNLKRIIQFFRTCIYSILSFIWVFFIIYISLYLWSWEYRSWATSWPGIWPAFWHWILLTIGIFLITPISVLWLWALALIEKLLKKHKKII